MRAFVKVASVSTLVTALAQVASAGSLIDESMAGELDFRSLAFSSCFGQPTCTVDLVLPEKSGAAALNISVTISAERNGGLLSDWHSAQIYWDPVDGLGVMGGGQNDEIDFDERLVVELGTPVNLGGLWLTDMFVYEQINYGARFSVQDDLEAADVVGSLRGETVLEDRITGEVSLPDDPFNGLLGGTFQESGDLLNRALIDDGKVSILMRDESGVLPDRIIRAVIGEIDPSKTGIFDGVEVVEIDVATLLGDAEFLPLLAVGNGNASRIEAMLGDQIQLASLKSEAERQRFVSSVPNGEVGAKMERPTLVDRLVFTAEVLSSNDYSVAGFLVAR